MAIGYPPTSQDKPFGAYRVADPHPPTEDNSRESCLDIPLMEHILGAGGREGSSNVRGPCRGING